MTESLYVFLSGERVGVVSLAGRECRLEFEQDWFGRPDRQQLSMSLPRTRTSHEGRAVTAYLWGLLPDNESVRQRWSREFHTTLAHPLGLLAQVGLDCAGAVQFSARDELVTRDHGYEPYDESAVAGHIESLRTNPTAWLIDEPGRTASGRFSLAGAQEKFALAWRGEQWMVPMGGAASTHIFKPDLNPSFPRLIEVEHVMMTAAGRLGITVPKTRVQEFGGTLTLIEDRFDRTSTGERIHTEDFCQALGVHPSLKYQNEGGPGVSDLSKVLAGAVLRRGQLLADRQELWRRLAFAALTGGTDAHAKNYSLLLRPTGARLALAYDLASVLPYGLATDRKLKLAMKFGRQCLIHQIRPNDLVQAAGAVGVDEAWALGVWQDMRDRLPDVVADVVEELKHSGVTPVRAADLPQRLRDWSGGPRLAVAT